VNLGQTIRTVQATLGVTVDGNAGPETWAAIHARICGTSAPLAKGTVDARSEKNIATLLPQVRDHARSLVHLAAGVGITIKITSGTRTFAEQDALFAEGGVTKARGGHSNHNFGIAFDVTVFEGAKPVFESPRYKVVGALGRSIGLEWGGDWASFVDEPHFQLRPAWAAKMSEKEMLAEFRKGRAFA